MSNVDMDKVRRETMRWQLLFTLHVGEPVGAGDVMLKSVVDEILHPPVTPIELHQQLGYLEKCELCTIDRDHHGHWHARLTAYGVNVVEYAVACPEGIKQPAKYWAL